MKANIVGWFEIYVQDMARAVAFYQAVFNGTLEKLESPDPGFEMMAFPMDMEQTGAPGALVKMADCGSGGNSTVVYFSCEDCANEGGRVASAGGNIVKEKMSIGPYGFIVLATDTEGNMIGLHSLQ